MEFKRPESMDDLFYYTYRDLAEGKGEIKCWVFKKECPSCHKALLEKPRNKNGKVKVRSKEFICPECGFTISSKDYESELEANIEYICPSCKHKGTGVIPFKRKKIKGVLTLVVECENCNEKMLITRKMKKTG